MTVKSFGDLLADTSTRLGTAAGAIDASITELQGIYNSMPDGTPGKMAIFSWIMYLKESLQGVTAGMPGLKSVLSHG
jgi:hypothetical protein